MKSISNPVQLSVWLAENLSKDLRNVMVTTSAVAGQPSETVFLDEVSSSWKADECAKKIYDSCQAHADSIGGNPRYQVNTLNSYSQVFGKVTVSFTTMKDAEIPVASLAEGNAFKLADQVVSRYDKVYDKLHRALEVMSKLNDSLAAQNQSMFDRMMASRESLERALDQSAEREMLKASEEAWNRRVDASFDAFKTLAVKFGPFIAAKKMKLEPEQTAMLMAMMREDQKQPQPVSTEAPKGKGGALGALLADIPDEEVKTLLRAIPDDVMVSVYAKLDADTQDKVFRAVQASQP